MPALWRGRSVRAQLLLVFVLIDIVTIVAAGGIAVLRARAQTGIEMAASMRLAEALVSDAVGLARQQRPAEEFLTTLPAQLRTIRHVRITVKNAAGVPVAVASAADGARGARTSAPDWFAALVAQPSEFYELPVIVNNAKVGSIEIVGEPGDEIDEFWNNTTVMGGVVVLLNIAMIVILYVLFGRVLDPLTMLATRLSELERRSYGVRMPKPQPRELAALTDHFNALAIALENARAENLRLNRRLITAQDDERRRTALELHDEVGPCLFGLKAGASSIAKSAAALPDPPRLAIAERLSDLTGIIDHLQAINRSMLERLRPMALGHIPLAEMLRQLVSERAHQHPQLAFSFDAARVASSYGDSIDLTIYRCAQENLTNAIRHAQARHVAVALRHVDDELVLTIRDDGCGIYPGAAPGYGIAGMQERVSGLGGQYAIDSEAGGGTCVCITVPLLGAGSSPANTGEISGKTP